MLKRLPTIVLLTISVTCAGGVERALPPPPGQTYATTDAGTLYAGRTSAGLDFNVWFDPAGAKPARIVFDKISLPKTNLALGAAFGSGTTVYVLVQRALTQNTTDQEVYAVDRVSGQRRQLFRVSDLGLLLALGERFEYDAGRDILIFSAARTERVASGGVRQTTGVYEYGPITGQTPRLRRQN